MISMHSHQHIIPTPPSRFGDGIEQKKTFHFISSSSSIVIIFEEVFLLSLIFIYHSNYFPKNYAKLFFPIDTSNFDTTNY